VSGSISCSDTYDTKKTPVTWTITITVNCQDVGTGPPGATWTSTPPLTFTIT
jgi:hypothetical protein